MKKEYRCGTSLQDVAQSMEFLAETHNQRVEADFNDIALFANPGDTVAEILNRYEISVKAARAESARQRAEYEKTPEGIEERRKADDKAANIKSILDLEGGKPRTFDVADKEEWDKTVAANTDDYSACVIRYAARWAALMDANIANGSTVAECAKRTSHEADIEGITGFMYGCAVSILSKAWKHGEALRRWHNLDAQLGKEGEKANEIGGVLNPAILTTGNS